MTTDATAAKAGTTATAPVASPAEELSLLGQITRRAARLSTGGKVWLRDRLTAEIDEEL
jgi:hypothetical protein